MERSLRCTRLGHPIPAIEDRHHLTLHAPWRQRCGCARPEPQPFAVRGNWRGEAEAAVEAPETQGWEAVSDSQQPPTARRFRRSVEASWNRALDAAAPSPPPPPAAGEEDIGLPGADSGLRAEAGIGLEVDIGRAGDTAAGAVGRTGLGPDSPGGRSYKTSTGGFRFAIDRLNCMRKFEEPWFCLRKPDA